MYSFCARCKTNNDLGKIIQPIVLVGHYHTILCQDCRNDLQETFAENELYLHWNRERAFFFKTQDVDKAISSTDRLMVLEKELFQISKAWVEKGAGDW